MAYLTTEDARRAFREAQSRSQFQKSATAVLNESSRGVRSDSRFDIFLSHSLHDAEVIAGVKAYLDGFGLSVYVDWIEDAQLDRSRVTPATADLLRGRMRQSQSLIFATSDSSPNSKWMPWELGYFDGLRQGRVAVLPLVARDGEGFTGQEYLGLYPKIEKLPLANGGTAPFVTRGAGTRTYLGLRNFRDGETLFKSF